MLREAVEHGSPLGLQAKSVMERGELVPDDVMIGLVADRVQAPDAAGGFVLDGFPRTVPQAVALGEMLRAADRPLDRAVVIDVAVEVIVHRLAGRRTCSVCGRIYHVTMDPPREADRCDDGHGPLIQRPDDREQVIRERLSVYCTKTAPLVSYYRGQGQALEVNGEGSPAEVFARLLAGLGGRESRRAS
jgi:adenylate kinase